MRILLADSRPRVRFALRALLEEQPGSQIVGEAAHYQDLLSQLKATCTDLLLLGWKLPGLPGKDPLLLMRRLCPQLYVISLSGQQAAQQIALAAGADAFVSKVAAPEELLAAIGAAERKTDANPQSD